MLASFLCREFLLYIPCCLIFIYFYLRSFSYESRVGFIFLWGVSPTHPMFFSFFFNLGSFSYTSRAGFIYIYIFIYIWGVSPTHLMLVFFFFGFVVVVLSGEFLLHIPCWFLFLSADFLLHISCWLHFCLESFSYRSRAGFIFLWGVSLTHPVLASFLSGEFLLHIPFFSFFFFFLFFFKSREFLLHIPCWLLFHVVSFSGLQSSLKTTPKDWKKRRKSHEN